MTLSRKHYEAVAEILRDERAIAHTYQVHAGDVHPERKEGWIAEVDRLEDRLCAYFLSDNPQFDPGRFRRAAQP